MHRGYTKRWRKRWDKQYCKDHLLWVMMAYFIDHANYKDTEVYFPNIGLIPLKRGQHIFSSMQIAEKLGVDRQRIRTKLKKLEKLNFLTIKPTNKYSIATVINYDTYQPSEIETNQQTNQQLTSSQPATNQQLTTPNKDKKEKKVNKEKKRAVSWPKDFILTDDMKQYAIKNGIAANRVDAFWCDFKDWAEAKGATYKDWYAAFRTRVGKAQEYGKQFLASGGQEPSRYLTDKEKLKRWNSSHTNT